jgi:hypothetical protein
MAEVAMLGSGSQNPHINPSASQHHHFSPDGEDSIFLQVQKMKMVYFSETWASTDKST